MFPKLLAAQLLLGVWESGGIGPWGGGTGFVGHCSVTVTVTYGTPSHPGVLYWFYAWAAIAPVLSFPCLCDVCGFLVIAGSVYPGFGRRQSVGLVNQTWFGVAMMNKQNHKQMCAHAHLIIDIYCLSGSSIIVINITDNIIFFFHKYAYHLMLCQKLNLMLFNCSLLLGK